MQSFGVFTYSILSALRLYIYLLHFFPRLWILVYIHAYISMCTCRFRSSLLLPGFLLEGIFAANALFSRETASRLPFHVYLFQPSTASPAGPQSSTSTSLLFGAHTGAFALSVDTSDLILLIFILPFSQFLVL